MFEELKEINRAITIIFLIAMLIIFTLRSAFDYDIDHYLNIKYLLFLFIIPGALTIIFPPEKNILYHVLKQIEHELIHFGKINTVHPSQKHARATVLHFKNYPKHFFALKFIAAAITSILIIILLNQIGFIAYLFAIICGLLVFFISSSS